MRGAQGGEDGDGGAAGGRSHVGVGGSGGMGSGTVRARGGWRRGHGQARRQAAQEGRQAHQGRLARPLRRGPQESRLHRRAGWISGGVERAGRGGRGGEEGEGESGQGQGQLRERHRQQGQGERRIAHQEPGVIEQPALRAVCHTAKRSTVGGCLRVTCRRWVDDDDDASSRECNTSATAARFRHVTCTISQISVTSVSYTS